MNKRLKILMFTVLPLSMIVVLSPMAITFFFFPLYKLIGEGIMFLLVGAVQFFSGFVQIQAAKRIERPIFWWKNYLIVFALMAVSLSVLFIFLNLIQINQQIHAISESNIGALLGISLSYLL